MLPMSLDCQLLTAIRFYSNVYLTQTLFIEGAKAGRNVGHQYTGKKNKQQTKQ
jgi:hypothetical protein